MRNQGRKEKEMSTGTVKDKAIGIRIPSDWHKILSDIAEDECRTVNSVINHAIKEYIKRKKK